MSNIKPILGPCDSYQLAPFAYPWAWEMYQDCRANEWQPSEIGVGEDVADIRSGELDERHRHLFLSVMAQLTTFDIERGDDAAETFLQIIEPAEMKQFLKRLIFEEAGHTESYRYCIENMSLPESGPDNIYDVWKNVPAMTSRVEMAQRISDELMIAYAKTKEGPLTPSVKASRNLALQKAFLRAAFFWFLVFEGVWFWMALLGPVQQLSRLGVFRKTAEQFLYIARDEAQHIRFGLKLIQEFMRQYPDAVSEDLIAQIEADTKEAVELEKDFILYCLKDGPILGYSSVDHLETTKFFANMRLRSIGFNELYPGAEHRFPWMSEQMELKKEANFFEKRVTEYQTGRLEFETNDDQFGSVM